MCTAPNLISFFFGSFVVVLSYAKKSFNDFHFFFSFSWNAVAVGSEPWCYFSLLLSLIISYLVGIFSICERREVRYEIRSYDVIKSFRITIQNRFVCWLHDKYQGHFTFGRASSIQWIKPNKLNEQNKSKIYWWRQAIDHCVLCIVLYSVNVSVRLERTKWRWYDDGSVFSIPSIRWFVGSFSVFVIWKGWMRSWNDNSVAKWVERQIFYNFFFCKQ